jgi:CRISPR type III-B/RAMP module-associated protein Cmr5
MPTRSQEWSKSAFARVGASGRTAQNAVNEKYRTCCSKMPGLIHQSGLLQALVFQATREEDGRTYVDDLARTYLAAPNPGQHARHTDLIAAVQSANLNEYMAMTHDLAEIAQWFRRFSQILLVDSPAGGKP